MYHFGKMIKTGHFSTKNHEKTPILSRNLHENCHSAAYRTNQSAPKGGFGSPRPRAADARLRPAFYFSKILSARAPTVGARLRRAPPLRVYAGGGRRRRALRGRGGVGRCLVLCPRAPLSQMYGSKTSYTSDCMHEEGSESYLGNK